MVEPGRLESLIFSFEDLLVIVRYRQIQSSYVCLQPGNANVLQIEKLFFSEYHYIRVEVVHRNKTIFIFAPSLR